MFGKFTRTNISAFLACTLLFAGVAMLVSPSAQAAPGINPEIPFHGVLKDDLGDPLTGSYDMTFVIYDAPTGGTALWTGLYTVTVTDGTFKVMLGSGGSAFGALDFTDDTYYIGLTVEADAEMTPRQRIGASAYAFNADKLDGYDSTDFLNLSASTSMATTSATTLFTLTQNGAGDILNLFSGATEVFTVNSTGMVGVGTSSPGHTLSVEGDVNVASGSTYKLNGMNMIIASTTFESLYFGGSGNLTATGSRNVALGISSLASTTGGTDQTAIGYQALMNDANTGYAANTAVGSLALKYNLTGTVNTAVGSGALWQNTTGSANTAAGTYALVSNTTGYWNSALGSGALAGNTTGYHNNAFGYRALYTNSIGTNNVAIGNASMFFATSSYNVAVGGETLRVTTTGGNNVAVGYKALYANTTGSSSIAIGYQAGDNITTGSKNIVIGYDIDAPSATGNNQLNIGNIIFGTGLIGSGSTIAGKIGIGTTSPSGLLSISNSVGTTADTPLFTIASTTGGTATTTLLTVLASGNVGIGTTSANASLEVGRNSSGVSGIFDVGAGAIPFAFGWADNTQYHRLRSAGAANDNIILELVNPSTHYLSIGGLLNTVYGASIGYGAGSVTPPNLGLLVNGNVGIGTTTPTSLLSVAGDARIGGLLTTGTLTATGTVTFSALGDGCLSTASGIVTSSGSACGSGGGGASNWTFNGTYLTPSSTVGIGVFASSTIGGGTDTTGLTIYGGATTTGRAYFAGNVGIGTPSPSVQLHIMSTTTDAIQWTQSTSSTNQSIVLAANENASQYAYLAQHGSSYAGTMDGISRAGLSLLAFNGTNALIRSVGTAPMIFSTNGAERMRITSAGYVGIGTTTPTDPLTVEGNVKIGDELTFGLTGAINSGGGLFYMRKTGSEYPEEQPKLFFQDMNFAGQVMGFGLTTDGTSEGTSLNIKQSFGDIVATFTDTGNVGIGTTSPSAKLAVNGTASTTGPELITNGTFTGSATGWTLPSGCASYGSAAVTVTYDAICQGDADQPEVSTDVDTVSGAFYRLTFTLSSVSGDTVSYFFGNNGTTYESSPYGNGTHTVYFTTDFTGTDTLSFGATNYNIDGTWTIDDVSLVEIVAPRAVLTVVGFDGNSWLSLGGDVLANTALGDSALSRNTTGAYNTAYGYKALTSNTSGTGNMAGSYRALYSNTSGSNNIALGGDSLYSNTSGSSNHAIGQYSLFSNTTGYGNIALGESGLYSNTSGSNNIALGSALYANTTGFGNIVLGDNVLNSNTTGSNNIGIGVEALYQYNGTSTVAVGYRAGYNLTTGNSNTFLGAYADTLVGDISSSTAIGAGALVGCSNCLALGGVGANAVKVGIGSTSPSSLLTIANTIDTVAGTPLFTIASTTGGTSTSTLFTVLASGNVGIGTNAPRMPLEVYGNGASADYTNLLYLTSSYNDGASAPAGYGAALVFRHSMNSTGVWRDSGRIGTLLEGGSGNNTAMTFSTIQTGGSLSERMRISSSGNVGIGTTTPTSLLSVAGDARIGGLLTTGTLTATGTVTFSALGDGCLSTASGIVTSSGSACGSGGGASNWTFNGTYLTPSSTVGIGVFASSTIGGGTDTTGLTIYGGATTTGRAYFGGNVAMGTTTYAYNPVLSVAGDSAYSSGYNAVIGVKGYQTTANASGYYIGIGSEPVYTAGAGNSLFTLTGEFMNPTNVGGGHIDALYGSIATPKNILGTASTTAGYFSIPENASASTVDWMYGFVSEPMHSGSGTTTLMVNYFSDCWNTGTGMVDTCVGLYLDFEATQAHKFNNMYGIFQGNPVARNDFFGTVALDGNGYGIGSSPAPYARFSVTGRYGSTTPLFDVASTTGIGPLATSSIFRVNYDGKIGIGTTTPVSALTFASSTSASGGITMGDVTLYRSDTNVLATEDSLVVLGATFGIAGFYGNLTGGTAASGTLTIDSTADSTKGGIYLNPTGGLVGIGTTTPTEELTVVGFIQSTELLGGIASLETDASGNIIRTPSDERLKENIEPLENSLEKLLELRGVSYEWKDEERFGDQKEIGFIAQEVDLVLPEVVQKGGEYWSLNKANMLAVVVEAVKEIYAKVEEYFARTEALEAENVELKARIEALEDEVGITPEPVPETTGGGSQEPIPEEPMQETPGEGETPAENQPSDTPAEGTIVEEQILAEEPVAEEPLPVDEPVAEPAPEPAPEETPSEPEPVVTEPVL